MEYTTHPPAPCSTPLFYVFFSLANAHPNASLSLYTKYIYAYIDIHSRTTQWVRNLCAKCAKRFLILARLDLNFLLLSFSISCFFFFFVVFQLIFDFEYNRKRNSSNRVDTFWSSICSTSDQMKKILGSYSYWKIKYLNESRISFDQVVPETWATLLYSTHGMFLC